MKKLLLSLAMVLGLAPAITVNAAEPTFEQQWVWGGEGWGDGWDGTAPDWSSTDAIKAQACTRFATAKDGKIYLINMKTMSIAQLTADGVKDLYKLPSLEGQSLNDIPDYYGTSITMDEAGNFLIGHFFTKVESVLRYTIYSPSANKAKTFTLDVPAGMEVKRQDTMGRVLGDLTKKAYAYVSPSAFVAAGTHATNQKVRVLTFSGDGDVDNVTLTSEFSGMVYLSNTGTTNICQPKYSSMEAAAGVPATSTFISFSSMVSPTTKLPVASAFGFTATGAEDWGYSGLASKVSTSLNAFDTFVLGGKPYYAINYLEAYDETMKSPMSVGIYDADFNLVASWTNADYVSTAGYSSIIAEPVSDTEANVYIFNSTGNLAGEKKNYGCGAQLKFVLGEELEDGVLFADDFEWLAPYAAASKAGDAVATNNPSTTAPQLVANETKVDGVSAYDAVVAKGYSFVQTEAAGKDPRDPGKQEYLQANYLKFGLTGFYSGLVLPVVKADLPEGHLATISFDWCSQRQGSGKWDPTALVVVVKNGTYEQQFLVPTHEYVNDEAYAWLHADVALEGAEINKNTTITIRNIDEQWPADGVALRFYLDNIKITTSEAAPGTKANPHKIATAEDLGNMYKVIAANTAEKQYFVMTEDIDMAGVTDYTPAIGSDGKTYAGSFDFDGRNHIIRNFAPVAGDKWYMSLFGVVIGDVRNLGVENANVNSPKSGTGVLGGYAAYNGVNSTIENVWVTGSVTSSAYTGGFVGTNSNQLTIKNCYFNGKVNGTYAGGLVGRGRAGITIENSYAAGDVTATLNAGGIAGTDKALAITLNNVIAWNTTVTCEAAANAVTTLTYDAATVQVFDGMKVNGAAVEGGVDAETLAATATKWAGWNKNLKDGYPALGWEEVKATLGTEENPFKVATTDDLVALKQYLSLETPNYVVLTADLDMAGVAFTPFYPTAGKGVAEIHFDGQKHIISNLTVNGGGASLFGYFTGSIKDLGLENIAATAGGWDPAGTFACYAYGEATIENSFATGSVSGFYAAGLFGGVQEASSLTVKNCYANVTCTASNGYAGGLVGPANTDATLVIENSYASGKITGNAAPQNGSGAIAVGKNTAYTGQNITIKDCAAIDVTVNAGIAGAVIANYDPEVEDETQTVTITNALISEGTLVNGAAVEGAVSKYDIFGEITAWEGWNEKFVNGMPALAWQDANEELIVLSTPEDLAALANELGEGTTNIVLLNDIDMEGTAYTPAKCDGKIINFDGQCHVIKNLTATADQSALFINFQGSVKNLGLENVNMTGGQWGLAGGLATYVVNEAVIENCYTTGKAAAYFAAGMVGGVQANGHLTIRNCYSQVDVTSGNGHAGGLVGAINPNGVLDAENCYASGNVSGFVTAGGVFAGAKTYLVTEPTTANLTNVAALNPSVTCEIAGAIIAPFDYLTVNLTDGYVSDETFVNGEPVEGAISKNEILAKITAWEGYNEKLSNGMPVLAWQTVEEQEEQGTQENPYRFTTAEDLCNMHKLMTDDRMIYIVLENDIDMEGITDYVPAIGQDGMVYVGTFDFDGQNHVIKNFAPDAKYYYESLFGVVRGNVRNLGVENCEIVCTKSGTGALGGYAGHNGIKATIDNVWVTGSVEGGSYTGGLIGTNGADCEITNSYFNGEVVATGLAGGLVGRARAGLTIKNAYAAGTVEGISGAAGIASSDKAADQLTIVLENVIAWNTAVDCALKAEAVTGVTYDAATVLFWDGMKLNDEAVTGGATAELLGQTATGWEAYADVLVEGYPVLKWQYNPSAVEGVEAIEEVAPIYYNLQGVRVENPTAGFYIKKQGNKVSKVIIR